MEKDNSGKEALKRDISEQEKSYKGQFCKKTKNNSENNISGKRIVLEKKNLKRDNSEQEKSYKGQFWNKSSKGQLGKEHLEKKDISVKEKSENREF